MKLNVCLSNKNNIKKELDLCNKFDKILGGYDGR